MKNQESNKGGKPLDVVPALSSKHHTISEIIDAIGYGTFQIQLSVAAGVAFLADAMEIMILSVLGPVLKCSHWGISTTEVALLTTSVFIAMAISSPVWGFVADVYGRRMALVISSSLLLLFGLITAFSPSYAWLVVFRFLCGCCISCMPQCITILLEYLPS
jgi:MFS family permease